ncbi:prion-like-(Q/N-rich) domain-bearing protein 25 isoform X1 [Stomoxys calcitrans]|uniref:prion-like-(Q/N-rich) domain-bearing protein 25 isoform X1 n=2 Tax=Stomoxys calcitrans TaxID=35570 RepID=UPI0027E34EFC|nr:prion-like-(Q/N-rich) domain-bearing protein 25 isoform X1 [Stomoxys calcitrans]
MLSLKNLNILHISVVICLLATGSNTFSWPCEGDADCSAQGSKCNIAYGRCECNDAESVFSSNFTQCLKGSLYGDECEESVQCNLMPSGTKCKSGVCACADDETYVRGRCRQLNGLNQYCDTDLDCYFAYDRNSVQCEDNLCTCANGYYHRHGNICRRKSMDIDDACVVNADCQEIGENVECVSLKCQYVNEIQKDNVTTSQVKAFNNNNDITNSNYDNNSNNNNNNNNDNIINNNNITTKRQTSTATSSETTSNISKSSPSDSVLDNQSRLLNGDIDFRSISDTESEDIITDPADHEAKAKEELHQQQDQAVRVVLPSKYHREAATATEPEAEPVTKKLREIAVQTSIEAFELKFLAPKTKNVGTVTTASTSSSSRRPSKQRRRPALFRFDDDEKTFSTVSNTDDDIENRNFGSSCTDNGKPCTGLPHSICSNGICLCKQGYYNKSGKCFAELGEIAESTDECENEFDPVSKKCICQKNFFYERNLRGCRKPIQYHLSCTSNSQCSPFGAAYCQPDIPRRCTCEEYAEYDNLLQMCVYKQGLGSECDSNDACTIEHTICSNRHCMCKEGFVQKDEQCVPGLGAECLDDNECTNVANSKCEATTSSGAENIQKTCQCRKGFVHFKDECLKEAEEIEEECDETEQCKPLLATCVNRKCSCADEQHFQNGRCEVKKELGEPCSRASECFVEKEPENVECRNSVCQCKIGLQTDVEQKICYRVAPSKKNSSGRPSALKIITFLLIGSAFLITSAAIKQAYY